MSLDLAAAVSDCSTDTLSLGNQYVSQLATGCFAGGNTLLASACPHPSPISVAATREISDQGASQLAVSLSQNSAVTALDLEENVIEVSLCSLAIAHSARTSC